MIIKGIFRRYERWNPVHPTYGAFWGMGLGIGCGVGWGPGFGPEVVGYVGAGCGVGFNVGITLAGVGVGLPANALFTGPYNAVLAAKKGLSELSLGSNLEEDDWKRTNQRMAAFGRHLGGRLSDFNQKLFFEKGFTLAVVKDWPGLMSREVGKFRRCLLKDTEDKDEGDGPTC